MATSTPAHGLNKSVLCRGTGSGPGDKHSNWTTLFRTHMMSYVSASLPLIRPTCCSFTSPEAPGIYLDYGLHVTHYIPLTVPAHGCPDCQQPPLPSHVSESRARRVSGGLQRQEQRAAEEGRSLKYSPPPQRGARGPCPC